MVNLYRGIAKIVPKKLRVKVASLLSYSHLLVDPEKFLGFTLLNSALIGVLLGFILAPLLQRSFWIFSIAGMGLTVVLVYLWIQLLVDKKARLVEESLPDALQLMASNLRAGMTPDKALLLSSRPEFGPLKEEIDLVGKKVTLGKGVGTALMEMTSRINSKKLVRAIELINSGLDSGGSLATLLEATSNDLREQILVDKKIKASVTMYVMFIFSAAGMITPILFGLNSFLVEILRTSLSSVEIPAAAISTLPIKGTTVSVSAEFLMIFIIAFMVMNCLMASMLLGLIAKGKSREGLRYFLPMILIAIPVFFLVRIIINYVLGGLFTF
jgi:hypothetical protein